MSEKVEDDKPRKALFLQRFIAFCIDMILVSLLASILSYPFINQEKIEKLEKEELEVIEQIQNDNYDTNASLDAYKTIYYKTARENGLYTLILIFIEIVYFVVYQIIHNGQTIGKKLMKIRIISDTGELSTNQMIFRSFISNYILLSLINFVFMLFGSKEMYFYISSSFALVQFIIVLISVFMIMNRKNGRGIHDRLVHTTVIRE